ACGTPYGIPADNPFAAGRCQPGDSGAGRPEIWAWGLRNVWRMSFDRATGELWAADVGQDDEEEINLIEGGHNYGWNQVEGRRCFIGGCDQSAFTPPVWSYTHDLGESVTGGYVYRGPSLPELWGAYVFGDYTSGRIWALRQNPGGEPDVQVIAETRRQITSFGEGPDGELYVVTFDDGVGRLERAAPPVDVEPLPERLSDTGCFTDTATHALAPGVVPYGVNARLWSDGADKLRAFALPAGGVLGYRDDGVFDLPPETVLIKTFVLPAPDGTPRRVETRLIRRGADGWNGYSYRWTDDQTDAVLLPASATRTVETPDGPIEWHYPSRSQCDQCHIQSQGYALGLSTRQLNRRFAYPRGEADQLAALAEPGYLALPGAPAALPAFPDIEDADADIEARARAYLDANCASCHRPDGPANADIDLRAATPLAATGLCDVAPGQGDLGIADARLLAPGDPERSVLLRRMQTRGEKQMPPIASTLVDPFGTALVGAWIQMMPSCP
ncbi:MAG: PQQ-dependent sugar dehydrogenase, partial [bacterium]